MKNVFITSILFSLFTIFGITTYGQVSPLMTTTWNQGCYYNEDCPADGAGVCGNVYTGCAATGLAQVMKYYSHPVNGWGTHSYTAGSYGLQSADFSTANYNWSAMPNSLSSSNAEVAKLMYHLGVSVEMIYGPTVSNSFFENPLTEYFKYSPKAHTVSKLTLSNVEFEETLKSELDAGRVVYVKGGGHFYVIDGYQTSPLEFHCNFGWGGIYDGFYDLHNVMAGGTDYSPFTALIQIEPLTELEISVDTVSIGVSGGSANYEFSSLASWTAVSSQTWCTPSLLTGGEGYFNYTTGASASITANPTYSTRYADITYNDGLVTKTVTIAQAGITPTLSVSSGITESAGGGSHSGSISTDSIWTATPDQTWISVTPGSGSGNGTLSITIDPNPSTSTRYGNIVVDRGTMQELIPVTQTGSGATWCSPTMTTPNLVGVDNVTFNTINRTSSIDEGFIITTDTTEILLGSSHTISVSLVGFVAPAAWIDWNQDGDFNDPGEAIIDPAGSTYPSFSGVISAPVSVPLTATEGLTRMRVYVKNFGTGPSYDPCASDAGGDVEDYHIMIKDPKYIDVDPLSLTYSSIGGLLNVNVDSDSSWVATTGTSWLSVSPSMGTGVGTVGITADPNSSTLTRTGSVLFTRGAKTKSVAVTQTGQDTLLVVSPSSLSFTSDGGLSSFDVSSNVSYSILSSDPWLSVSTGTGSGNMSVDLSYTINPTGSARNATVVVSSGTYSDTLYVTQDGTSTLTVTPLSLHFPCDGGVQSFDISTTSGWTLSTTDVWITTDLVSGSGNTTINVTADTNFTTGWRTSYIDITNGLSVETVTITQDSSASANIDQLDFQLEIYPNPTTEDIMINSNTIEPCTIQLFDANGRVIFNDVIVGSTTIDFSSYPRGVYILRTNGTNTSRSDKIIKQ